jgi:uncharacterized membrane protein YsdA (DUF1294 family)/cold shock CspA family protein
VARETGELVDWRDERGFGFIRRPAGGDLYVHIKTIGKSVDRPKVGDRLSYLVAPGKNGRPTAVEVEILAPKQRAAPAAHVMQRRLQPLAISTRIAAAASILILLSAAIVMDRLPVWLAAFYLIAGVGSFIFYRADKLAAGRGAYRTPERKLLLVDLMFGVVGGLVAQHVYRHKTYKPLFTLLTGATVAVHVILLGLVVFGVISPQTMPAWIG